MKALKLIVSIGFVIILGIGCAKEENTSTSTTPGRANSPTTTSTATPDQFASIRPIFKENCSKCHGDTGEGGPVTVDGKKLRVPSFKSGHALKHTDQDFVDQIMNGGDGMPKFKDKLKPEQINELVQFIRKGFQGK